MASISLIVLAFIAVFAGFIYFYNKLKTFTGSVIVLVIGLVGLYIGVTATDLILDKAGFETGFPYYEGTEYYLFQAVIYIVFGLIMLGTYYFLMKESSAKEISHAFWWVGIVLLVTGGFDLLIETLVRVPLLEIKLLVAIVLLIGLILVATKFRDRLFGKKEESKPLGSVTK